MTPVKTTFRGFGSLISTVPDILMPKIVTLTPNPALDIAAHIDALVPAHKLRCGAVRRDPGGGGINVARVVHRLGGEAVAVYAAGGGSGDELAALLDGEGLRHRPARVGGHTRESFNLTDDRTAQQYRFILPGDPISEAECNGLIRLATTALAPNDYLVGSGSLPPGAPQDFYARAIAAAKPRGALTAIDSQGEPLAAALAEGVYLAKASAREWSAHLDAAPEGVPGWHDVLRPLVASSRARMAIVTLGADGAVLVAADAAWHASVPRVESITTVGAGDSFLGALLVKLIDGAIPDDALRYAAAAGTASLLVTGTGLCAPAEVERLSAQVTVRAI